MRSTHNNPTAGGGTRGDTSLICIKANTGSASISSGERRPQNGERWRSPATALPSQTHHTHWMYISVSDWRLQPNAWKSHFQELIVPFGWKQQIREVLWPDKADAEGMGAGGALYAEQMMHDDEYN